MGGFVLFYKLAPVIQEKMVNSNEGKIEVGKDKISLEYKYSIEQTTEFNKSVPNRTMGNDKTVTTEMLPKAKFIDTLNYQTNGYWVYLGQGSNGHWTTKNFKFDDIPKLNTELQARTATYKRKTFPKKGDGDNWILGEAIGVVDSGQVVHILSIQPIPNDNNYWAYVN